MIAQSPQKEPPPACREAELAREHLREVSEQSISLYQDIQQERGELAAREAAPKTPFSVLFEVEVSATEIAGYASWIINRGFHNNAKQALAALQKGDLFEKPDFARWYLSPDNPYSGIKRYVQLMDYLRLLVMEYLTKQQAHLPAS